MSAAGARHRAVQAVAIAAILFGIATVVAGARALVGAGPGYVVYRPLLVFNTAMGFAYGAVGVMAWRRLSQAAHAAAAICVLNVIALAWILSLYMPGGPIARESLQAMAFRTVVWLVLLAVLLWARSPAFPPPRE
jgi:hypothetical protein